MLSLLLTLYCNSVVLTAQEIRLSCRHEDALPISVSTTQFLSCLIGEDVKWNHDRLISDVTNCEICPSSHGCVTGTVGKLVASVNVIAVRSSGTNHVPRVEVLNSQLNIVVFSCVFAQISFHEKSQVYNASELQLVFPGSFLIDNRFVFVNQAMICAFCHNNNTVAFLDSSLDNLLIHSFLSINLEVNLRNDDYVDVTTC